MWRLLVLAAAACRSAQGAALVSTVTTFVGNGSRGSLDTAPGINALFAGPYGLALDSTYNVIVADVFNHRIRRASAAGVVTTLAGSGAAAFADGTGLSAAFNQPYGVALDAASGVTFVADMINCRIRKVTSFGAVSTFLGSGTPGSADGTGASASLGYPTGLALDSSGTLFISDSGNNRIRKVTPGGTVTLLAGGAKGFLDGAGAAAQFESPAGLAIDASGNIIVADSLNHRIRKINPGGVVTTLAGKGSRGYTDGASLVAEFASPVSVAIDPASGHVLIGDSQSNRIRKIAVCASCANPGVSTYAGSSLYASIDGAGDSASFQSPSGVALAPNGALYVSDFSGNSIRIITAAQCPAGFFCPNFMSAIICPPGFACPAGAAAPAVCAAGSFSATGSSSCTPCPRATYTAASGSLACESVCAAGSYGASLGGASAAVACSPCAAGRFTDYAGATACDACPPGRYSTSAGAASASLCLACPAGTLNPLSGSATADDCGACPPGSFSTDAGATRCTPCPPGSALDAGISPRPPYLYLKS